MKKLVLLSKSSLIIIFAMTLPLSLQAQDIQTQTENYASEQHQPAISGRLLAYHDLKEDINVKENMDIVDILLFVDESVKKGTLTGKGSGSVADVRLNVLVQKIESADDSLWNGSSFDLVCQELLDIYLLTDGLKQPDDSVRGPGAQILADKINYFSAEIVGCD